MTDIKHRDKGFTLIEVIIVAVIIGILSGIAYPGYIEYVQRARRSDGQNALLRVQLAQEKWRANNREYGTMAEIGVSTESAGGHYSKIEVKEPSATGYVATATSTRALAGDCHTLTITVSSAGEIRSPAECWN